MREDTRRPEVYKQRQETRSNRYREGRLPRDCRGGGLFAGYLLLVILRRYSRRALMHYERVRLPIARERRLVDLVPFAEIAASVARRVFPENAISSIPGREYWTRSIRGKKRREEKKKKIHNRSIPWRSVFSCTRLRHSERNLNA